MAMGQLLYNMYWNMDVGPGTSYRSNGLEKRGDGALQIETKLLVQLLQVVSRIVAIDLGIRHGECLCMHVRAICVK